MRLITLASVIFFATVSGALASEFCDGFKAGYETVKGTNVWIPYCPFEGFTPYDSTPFNEGVKAGIKAARGN
jgi:hypothetical protein